MRRKSKLAIGIALVLFIGFGVSDVAAQTGKYPKMADIDQYMMEKTAEIQLARSAAPESISADATILVLGRQGYETAVEGKNGFVCMVARSWMAAFDWDEFWNPKIRAADCMNPQAARSIVPIALLRSKMMMAGRSKVEMLTAVKAAFEKKQIPDLESGAMDYMMSKSAYLTDMEPHNMPHVMFFTSSMDGKEWGSNLPGSPIMSVPYWFFASKDPSDMKGLPSIVVFMVGVTEWSDGTPAAKH